MIMSIVFIVQCCNHEVLCILRARAVWPCVYMLQAAKVQRRLQRQLITVPRRLDMLVLRQSKCRQCKQLFKNRMPAGTTPVDSADGKRKRSTCHLSSCWETLFTHNWVYRLSLTSSYSFFSFSRHNSSYLHLQQTVLGAFAHRASLSRSTIILPSSQPSLTVNTFSPCCTTHKAPPHYIYTVCALIFAGFIFCGLAIFTVFAFLNLRLLGAVVLKYLRIYGVSPYTIIVYGSCRGAKLAGLVGFFWRCHRIEWRAASKDFISTRRFTCLSLEKSLVAKEATEKICLLLQWREALKRAAMYRVRSHASVWSSCGSVGSYPVKLQGAADRVLTYRHFSYAWHHRLAWAVHVHLQWCSNIRRRNIRGWLLIRENREH